MKLSANSLKLFTIIHNPTAPNKELNPLNLFNTAIAATISIIAPPIAVKPRPISLNDKAANFCKASPNILQASANTIKAIDVLNEIFTPSKNLRAPANIATLPKTANNPFPICLSDKFPSSLIAFDNILTAVAININDNPDLISPFELKPERVFVIDFKLRHNMVIMMPMANKDFPISSTFKSDIFSNADAKIPIAIAIPIMEATFNP